MFRTHCESPITLQYEFNMDVSRDTTEDNGRDSDNSSDTDKTAH
jgi:hypothetical protein